MCVYLVSVYHLLKNDSKIKLNNINIKEENYTKEFKPIIYLYLLYIELNITEEFRMADIF
jgi:hypothetical protein